MSEMSFEALLYQEMQDVYDAEHQITEALPLMASHATSSTLRKSFEKHLQQTEEQITRIESAAKLLNVSPKGKKCKGMEGVIKEGAEALKMDSSDVTDAALIGAAERVEHYEMAAYESLILLAKQVKVPRKVVQLLKLNMNEEKDTAKKLTEIAKTVGS